MNPRLAALLALPILLTPVACGNLKEKLFGSKKAETADFDGAQVKGDWVYTCHGVEAFGRKVHRSIALTVTDGAYTRKDSFFSDDDCKTLSFAKELKGKLEIGGSHDSNTRDALVTADALVMTVHDPEIIQILDTLKFCGIPAWTADQPTDVLQADCRAFSNQGKELNGVQMPLLNGKRSLKFVTVGGGSISAFAADIYQRAEDAAAEPPKVPCEYEDIPGKAEILLVSEKTPKDDLEIWLSLKFRSDDPAALQKLGLPIHEDFIPMAAIGYPRACAEGNAVEKGKTVPMTMQKAIKGSDCAFVRFRLPDMTPVACQEL